MNAQRQKPLTLWPLIVLFFVISTAVVVLGFLFYKSQEQHLLNNKLQELSGISDLKIRQITQWRQERISNAKFLSENRFLVRKLKEYSVRPDNELLRSDLIQSLKSLITNFDYKSILLLDPEGSLKLSFPVSDKTAGDHLKHLFPGIIRDRKVFLSDLHREDPMSLILLDMITPLINHEQSDSSVFGLLIMRIDPQKVLYPLIQSWPSPSKTAETLLIRQEGDEIVYLNELRHVKNSELILRKPLSEESLPAAKVVNGIDGTINGIDYRGVPVVAAMKKIPGSPWYMVAKIDRKELLSSLDSQMTMVIVIIILFILATGSTLGILWWNQRVRYYREKYEIEQNRLALVKHFDYILKFANDSIFLADDKLNIVEANDHASEVYQYSYEEFIGMNIKQIRSHEFISGLNDQIKIIATSGSLTFETVHRRKDNTEFHVEISTRLVIIEGRKYYQAICRDITSRKVAEAELEKSLSMLKATIESTADGILVVDSNGKIAQHNQKFLEMWNIPKEVIESGSDQVVLRSILDQLKDPDDFVKNVQQLYSEPETSKIDIIEFKNGRFFERFSQPQMINDKSVGRVWSFRDITESKKAEAQIIAAKEKAEESDRLKTAFLHNVSHEIRTPMNAIIGFSTLLNEPGLDEQELRQYTDFIFQSGKQLLSVINDIVDIANIEAGRTKVNMKTININFTLRSLKDQFSIKEISPGVVLNLKITLEDEETNIITDTTKLIQILSNLLNNAIKFTARGSVDFGYDLKAGFLEFYVNDTGIGIPVEHQDKIFNRFYQVDDTISRKFGGTGIGLSICKAYVELLGGKIWFTSQSGKGSSFRFTIPYKVSNQN